MFEVYHTLGAQCFETGGVVDPSEGLQSDATKYSTHRLDHSNNDEPRLTDFNTF